MKKAFLLSSFHFSIDCMQHLGLKNKRASIFCFKKLTDKVLVNTWAFQGSALGAYQLGRPARKPWILYPLSSELFEQYPLKIV